LHIDIEMKVLSYHTIMAVIH